MSIEKVFAIKAAPSDIYAALLRDIGAASAYEDTLFEVLERKRDERLRLKVNVGFVPCILTYVITAADGVTEVAARLDPYGWRWVLFQAGTLGLRRQNMEMVLVEGLANLKAEVEADTSTIPDDSP